MSRSRLLLLLILLLLGAVWYAWKETPRQQRVADRSVSQMAFTEIVEEGESVRIPSLDFSGGEESNYQKPKRDLFRPLYRPPIISQKPVVQPPKPPPVVKAPTPAPPKPRPIVTVPTGPKPIPPMTVLGFLQKEGSVTAFLTSRQGDLYLVKKGDRFAGDLLVRELDESEIVISRNLTDAGVTLNVGEKKNQRMAIPKLQSGRPSVPTINVNVPKTKAPTNVGEQ